MKRDWAREKAQRENPKKTKNHSRQAQAEQGEGIAGDAQNHLSTHSPAVTCKPLR